MRLDNQTNETDILESLAKIIGATIPQMRNAFARAMRIHGAQSQSSRTEFIVEMRIINGIRFACLQIITTTNSPKETAKSQKSRHKFRKAGNFVESDLD